MTPNYQREYYLRNRERILEQNRQWRAANRDATREQDKKEYAEKREEKLAWQKAYYLKNREDRLEWHRQYRLNNSGRLQAQRKTEQGRAALAERQARRRTARMIWADREAIKSFYAEARSTTKDTGVAHVVDHVVPLVHPEVCGLHNEFNLMVRTREANARKNNNFVPCWELDI